MFNGGTAENNGYSHAGRVYRETVTFEEVIAMMIYEIYFSVYAIISFFVSDTRKKWLIVFVSWFCLS